MKKVLVAYYSLTGKTEQMAQYISEGIRIGGHEAAMKKVADISSPDDIARYDGYIFGSPTQFSDIAGPMKEFLLLARKANLGNKLGGAFGSYLHDGNAPARIIEIMQNIFQMEPFELGALNLKETLFEEAGRGEPNPVRYVAGEVFGGSGEGMRACQDYGKIFAEKLGA
jgi:flavorubredoxin